MSISNHEDTKCSYCSKTISVTECDRPFIDGKYQCTITVKNEDLITRKVISENAFCNEDCLRSYYALEFTKPPLIDKILHRNTTQHNNT